MICWPQKLFKRMVTCSLRLALYPYDCKFSCLSSTRVFVQLFSEADKIKTLFCYSIRSAIFFLTWINSLLSPCRYVNVTAEERGVVSGILSQEWLPGHAATFGGWAWAVSRLHPLSQQINYETPVRYQLWDILSLCSYSVWSRSRRIKRILLACACDSLVVTEDLVTLVSCLIHSPNLVLRQLPCIVAGMLSQITSVEMHAAGIIGGPYISWACTGQMFLPSWY